jgi:FtsH-binding integral membrane protein
MTEFIGKVYGLSGVGLLVTALVCFLTAKTAVLSIPLLIVAFLVTLVLVMATVATRGLTSAAAFLGVSVAEGLMIGPLVKLAVAVNPMLLVAAILLTAVLFLVLTVYVFVSGKDFSFMGGGLLIALVALIIASVAAMFFPAMVVFVSAAGALVFGLFVLYDTSSLLNKSYEDDQYASAALSIYLDIVGLFVNLLSLLLNWK